MESKRLTGKKNLIMQCKGSFSYSLDDKKNVISWFANKVWSLTFSYINYLIVKCWSNSNVVKCCQMLSWMVVLNFSFSGRIAKLLN
jgi:hypothetical protein